MSVKTGCILLENSAMSHIDQSEALNLTTETMTINEEKLKVFLCFLLYYCVKSCVIWKKMLKNLNIIKQGSVKVNHISGGKM